MTATQQSEQRGELRGRQQGIQQGKLHIAKNMLSKLHLDSRLLTTRPCVFTLSSVSALVYEVLASLPPLNSKTKK
jgi:hypothetical protein